MHVLMYVLMHVCMHVLNLCTRFFNQTVHGDQTVHVVSAKFRKTSCYGHTSALAFQPPLYICVYCKANPLPASGAYPPEVRSTAANTQADATLPCIGVRGGAKRLITPGPHSQPFGGA